MPSTVGGVDLDDDNDDVGTGSTACAVVGGGGDALQLCQLYGEPYTPLSV